MPGFYPEDEYDLAGFAVGAADKKNLITGEEIRPGNALVGIASSGVHSNGFSLVRKVFDVNEENLKEFIPELGETLGDALLRPTKIYVRALKSVRDAGVRILGCSHVTGGGFYENIPRMLHDGVRAQVRKDSYEVPAIFRLLQKRGGIEEHMMYNTFNMGIGMVVAVDAQDAEAAVQALEAAGEKAFVIGNIIEGEKGVDVC
jgi:phosphoribosylformylglycinamidine cyclo-ligase